MFHYFNEDEFVPEDGIKVTSTSNLTASTNPIELCEITDTKRLVFEPTIVENAKEPESSVKGTLVYERKKKSDESFPIEAIADETLTRGSIKMGDSLTFNLSAGETRRLYEGLRDRYEVASVMGPIPYGTETYKKVDKWENQLLELLNEARKSTGVVLGDNVLHAIAELLKLVSNENSIDTVTKLLGRLSSGELQELTAGMNLTQLERARNEMLAEIDQSDEAYWQRLFKRQQWILSQVFATPCTVLTDQIYLGGKSINNAGGNVCDFAYKNRVTNNIALVEIKTPGTKLVAQTSYRHDGSPNAVYGLSTELTGAINQMLEYRETLIRESQALKYNSGESFEVFSPKCFLIVGDTRSLVKDGMMSTFERFRNSLENIEIVTFDELLAKVESLISVFRNNVSIPESNELSDQEYPPYDEPYYEEYEYASYQIDSDTYYTDDNPTF